MSKWQPGQLLFAGFEGTTLPPELARRLAQGRVGGVVLFTRNLVRDGASAGDAHDLPAVRALVRSIHEAAPPDVPVMIAIDQEGGRVQRLRAPWTEWPPMRRLGELGDDASTRRFASALAIEMRDLGIALNFVPVLDVDTNPANPVIGDRSFGRTPQTVIRHARIVIEAMHAHGVASCAKHFPGHGDTVSDSHFELPRLRHDLHRLREVELPPFAAAAEAGVAAMMTAHVVFEALDRKRPATLAPDVMNLLREELGYDGLVFTDDLEMRAVADHFTVQQIVEGALHATVDALLVCRSALLRDEVLDVLERQPDSRIERAMERMVAFKEPFAARARAIALAEPDDAAGPPYPEHQRLAEALQRG